MADLSKLAAEAMEGNGKEEDIDKRIDEALECPCVAAFRCYVKSTHEEKGMDCIDQFKAFQACLSEHPDHVEKLMKDAEATEQLPVDEVVEAEQPSPPAAGLARQTM
ncbi:hypothetical protein H632_c22p1 [Helicosporidium sp. ATCC 50920]|nr:hypothetical protein H632_c22p1 [Helicosporidium sp. ATCC 50920]|eukprot:KDD77088.1 hypothetical protein H632_c22p1 [Helicosporidium sp. ATCC 50920]